MSSWSYSVTINVDRLYDIARKLGSVSDMLLDVAEQTAGVVKENIKAENIIDTGALLGSIEASGGDDAAYVRDHVTYGIYNEFGTYKMAARPFFVPAVEKAGSIIESKFMELMT